jgi:hypothetical protein
MVIKMDDDTDRFEVLDNLCKEVRYEKKPYGSMLLGRT